MTEESIKSEFVKRVQGRVITNAYYDDATLMPVLVLDDGTGIFIQSDDEGNDAGVPIHVAQDATEKGLYQIRR